MSRKDIIRDIIRKFKDEEILDTIAPEDIKRFAIVTEDDDAPLFFDTKDEAVEELNDLISKTGDVETVLRSQIFDLDENVSLAPDVRIMGIY